MSAPIDHSGSPSPLLLHEPRDATAEIAPPIMSTSVAQAMSVGTWRAMAAQRPSVPTINTGAATLQPIGNCRHPSRATRRMPQTITTRTTPTTTPSTSVSMQASRSLGAIPRLHRAISGTPVWLVPHGRATTGVKADRDKHSDLRQGLSAYGRDRDPGNTILCLGAWPRRSPPHRAPSDRDSIRGQPSTTILRGCFSPRRPDDYPSGCQSTPIARPSLPGKPANRSDACHAVRATASPLCSPTDICFGAKNEPPKHLSLRFIVDFGLGAAPRHRRIKRCAPKSRFTKLGHAPRLWDHDPPPAEPRENLCDHCKSDNGALECSDQSSILQLLRLGQAPGHQI